MHGLREDSSNASSGNLEEFYMMNPGGKRGPYLALFYCQFSLFL